MAPFLWTPPCAYLGLIYLMRYSRHRVLPGVPQPRPASSPYHHSVTQPRPASSPYHHSVTAVACLLPLPPFCHPASITLPFSTCPYHLGLLLLTTLPIILLLHFSLSYTPHFSPALCQHHCLCLPCTALIQVSRGCFETPSSPTMTFALNTRPQSTILTIGKSI